MEFSKKVVAEIHQWSFYFKIKEVKEEKYMLISMKEMNIEKDNDVKREQKSK